jgi:hypothetical protein
MNFARSGRMSKTDIESLILARTYEKLQNRGDAMDLADFLSRAEVHWDTDGGVTVTVQPSS